MAKLNSRQRRYVEGLSAGKTKLMAALDAGYSRASAENAAQIIEGPDVRNALQAIVRREIGIEKLALRLREGLDAMETKFFHYKGKMIEARQVVAWAERRKYIELAVKYAGYYVEREQLDVSTENPPTSVEVVQELLNRAAARIAADAN